MEVLKAFWNAKDTGHDPVIKWSIADQASAYQPAKVGTSTSKVIWY